MPNIGFIGLGHMGGPMARNLLKAGFPVKVCDIDSEARARLVGAGATAADGPAATAHAADILITMLPEARHVRAVYLGPAGLIAAASPGALLIDCSTIDVATARELAQVSAGRDLAMIDAPVSGGVAGAEAATLTFMVGGTEGALERARPVLERMGKAVIHAGGAGNGQAAKICNNLILGVSMIGVCEAFALAERLGLSAERLFEVASRSSGQCWSLTSYCPVPGPVPTSPANRNYAPGFTAAMMLKDLKLATDAAALAGSQAPLAGRAEVLYRAFVEKDNSGIDFSAIIKMCR
jgi:3-hydroxyisobutyrate dehydrogenase